MREPPAALYRDQDGANYKRVEERLEGPMLALSILFVPVVLGPMLSELSTEAELALGIAGWLIWAAFALEFIWLFFLAPKRLDMVRSHKMDVLIVVLPLLRPLRLLRVLRLSMAVSGVGRATTALKRIVGRPGLQPFFGTVSLVILASAALALAFEHEQPGSNIESLGDAIWWALVTCTTVGYGDHSPVTGGGQIIAVMLMLVGITLLSVLTASIAALFVDQDDETENAELRAQLDRIENMLRAAQDAPSAEQR